MCIRDSLGGLGDEHALGWFQAITQLHFGEAHIRFDARVVDGVQRDELHWWPFVCADNEKPLAMQGVYLCPRRDLNPYARIKKALAPQASASTIPPPGQVSFGQRVDSLA